MLLVWTVWSIFKLNSRFQNVISDPFPSEMVFCGNEQACLNEGWELMFLSPKDNPNWSKYGTLLCTALLADFIWNVLPARLKRSNIPRVPAHLKCSCSILRVKLRPLSLRGLSLHTEPLACILKPSWIVCTFERWWVRDFSSTFLFFSFLASPHAQETLLVSSLISSFVFSSPLISSKLVL